MSREEQFKAWCRRLKASDRDAFAQVFRLLHDALFRYACYLTHDRAAARDLVQDAFLEVWRMRARLDPERSLEALLYRMVRNRAYNRRRDRRTRADRRVDLHRERTRDPGGPSLPDATLDGHALEERLRVWIDELPARQRESLLLSRYEELSHEEIAAVAVSLWFWQQPVRVTASPGEYVVVTLPDGSTAELNSGTTLSYRRGFAAWPFVPAECREVFLRSEAFFEVVEGTRPFVVETFNARIRVLGTRFNVRARPDAPARATRVTLAEGRVRLKARRPRQQPGHAVTLERAGQPRLRRAPGAGAAHLLHGKRRLGRGAFALHLARHGPGLLSDFVRHVRAHRGRAAGAPLRLPDGRGRGCRHGRAAALRQCPPGRRGRGHGDQRGRPVQLLFARIWTASRGGHLRRICDGRRQRMDPAGRACAAAHHARSTTGDGGAGGDQRP